MNGTAAPNPSTNATTAAHGRTETDARTSTRRPPRVRASQSGTTTPRNGGIQYETNSSTFSNFAERSPLCIQRISANASTVTTTADTGRRSRTPTVCRASEPL